MISNNVNSCAVIIKALLSPQEGLLKLGNSKGGCLERGPIRKEGLLERGAYPQSQMTRIYDSFVSSFTPYSANPTYNLRSQKHPFDTVRSIGISMQTYLAK